MHEQLYNWLIGAIVSLCAAIAFLYKTNSAQQAKLKQEHHDALAAMLADAKAERAVCQRDNEIMRQDIARLTEQLLALQKEHGELIGRLAEIRESKQ